MVIRINNAPWIHHNGGMICSVDIHPDGGKMATAGHGANVGSGLLIIWDIKNVWNEGYPTEVRSETEKLASIPFTKCVNCVRWSRAHNGRYLVTGGDEPEVTIWEYKGTFRSEGSIGSNKGPALREKYTAVHKLYGHQMDIIHLEWSHNGWFLATGSLDGKVVIWNARHFPDRIAVLDEDCSGHTDSVIGLSWDPIGKYLATFSFDKSVKIWQSDDWKCVKTITEPFADSARSVMFSRMDWSPDGSFLILPGAMNKGGPTAQIVLRKDFSYKRDLVGHRKAVICARFCSRMIKYAYKDRELKVSLLAIGSRDKSLSIWCLPKVDRPILVLENLFKHSLVDLSWVRMKLVACSMDGTVKFLDFEDVGKVLSPTEMGDVCEKKYGYRPKIYDECFGTSSSPPKQMRVIDDVDKWSEMHGMKELNGHSKDLVVSSPAKVPSQSPVEKINSTHNMAAPARPSQEVVQQGSSNTQMEFRTKSGKRKITPMFLGPLESAPTTSFSSSSISTQNQLQSTSTSNEPLIKRIASEPAITNIQPTTSSVERSSAMNVDESNLKRMGTFEPTASSASKRTRLYSASELPVLSEKPILRSLPELYSVTATTSAETNKIIPLPEHKKQLKAHIYGQLSLNSTDTAQVDNEFSYSFNMKLSRISAKCNEKILWEAYTGNVISLIDANRFWITLTTFQSTLMVYRADAGRLEFELALDSPASALFLLDNYCLVVSSNGVVSTWDLSEQRQLMSKSIVNLILGPESKITYKALTDAGLPVIGLDNSRFYVYSSSLDGWLIMQDTPEYDAKNAVSFEFVTKVNPGGILSKVLQGARLPPDVPVNVLHSIEEGQLEKYMNTAKSTNSGLEYRLLLNLYVQHLVEDGRDSKLTDLINELNSTEKICGISTSKLLADINPLISKKKA